MRGFRVYSLVAALLLSTLCLADPAAAQYEAKQKFVGGHLGLSGVGSAPAFGVSGEVAYNDKISIGGWLDTWSYGESFGSALGAYDWNVRYIAIAGTGAYHFPIESQPKLDPFVGLALGYFVVSTEAEGFSGIEYSGDASRVFLGGFGGARYFFKENLAGVARVGFGAAYLTIGVDLKL